MDKGRNSLVLLVLVLIITVLTFQFRSSDTNSQSIPINELVQELERGSVARLIIDGNDIEVRFNDGTTAVSRKESGKSAIEQFLDLGVSSNRLDPDSVEIEIKSSLLNSDTDLLVLIGVFGAGAIVGGAIILVFVKIRKRTLDE